MIFFPLLLNYALSVTDSWYFYAMYFLITIKKRVCFLYFPTNSKILYMYYTSFPEATGIESFGKLKNQGFPNIYILDGVTQQELP